MSQRGKGTIDPENGSVPFRDGNAVGRRIERLRLQKQFFLQTVGFLLTIRCPNLLDGVLALLHLRDGRAKRPVIINDQMFFHGNIGSRA